MFGALAFFIIVILTYAINTFMGLELFNIKYVTPLDIYISDNLVKSLDLVIKNGYKDISYIRAKELIGSTKEKVVNLKMRLLKVTENRKIFYSL